MIVTITNRSTKEEIESALKKLEEVNEKTVNGKINTFDAYKYCGIMKLREDPLTLQKKWRDEWD